MPRKGTTHWAWNGVSAGTLVDVEHNPRAGGSVSTWERHLGGWASCTPAAGDGDLEARGVELDAWVRIGGVERHKLVADDVVTRCKGTGHLEGVRRVGDERVLLFVIYKLVSYTNRLRVCENIPKPKTHQNSCPHEQP